MNNRTKNKIKYFPIKPHMKKPQKIYNAMGELDDLIFDLRKKVIENIYENNILVGH